MIRLLLDTHALLWAISEPDRLSRRARDAIATNENELLVSSASAWEIATKHRLGKLAGAEVLLASYTNQLERLGAVDLAVTSAHALVAGSFDVDHRDPFDRMIAAQAAVEGLDVVSSDPAFAGFVPFGVRVMW
jgi:PIN domain nuclease of toxin-antitoxin system